MGTDKNKDMGADKNADIDVGKEKEVVVEAVVDRSDEIPVGSGPLESPDEFPVIDTTGPSVPSPLIRESEEEAALRSLVSDAIDIDAKEWETLYVGIKEKGNYFDMVRNMYPFKLPRECEDLEERKVRHYGWPARENMDSRCDPSKLIHWIPVNRNNHPMLPSSAFNKHGGVYREGHYLCYMPWAMHMARNEIQREAAAMPTREQKEKALKEDEFGGHFDPTEGGRKSGGGSGDRIYEEGKDTHPVEVFEEAGSYE